MIRAAVLGGDVSRSRSPQIHLAAFAALGVAGSYEAFSTGARDFRKLVRSLGRAGYRYLNVTIPHKRAAAAVADTTAPLVRTTGAANTLIFRRPVRGRPSIRGENTDGYGLLSALQDLGVEADPRGRFVLVGSGGAAAGALTALLAAGARVRLVARRPAAARALARGLALRPRARVEVFPWHPEALAAALEGACALVSAVPAAAWQSVEARAGLRALGHDTATLEMAYGQPTPLRLALRGRTARYQDGIPMLVHQAARTIELALGRKPPVEPMFRAARSV